MCSLTCQSSGAMEKRSAQQQNWIHLGQKPLALEMGPVQEKNVDTRCNIQLFYIHPLQPTHCQLLLTCTPMTASSQTSHLTSHLRSSHTSKYFRTMYLSTAGLHIKTKNIQGVEEFWKASPLGPVKLASVHLPEKEKPETVQSEGGCLGICEVQLRAPCSGQTSSEQAQNRHSHPSMWDKEFKVYFLLGKDYGIWYFPCKKKKKKKQD